MIWIIGGTSETGELLEKIHGHVDYIATVATYVGSEVLKGKNTLEKRLSYEDMLEFIDKENIKTIVDLSLMQWKLAKMQKMHQSIVASNI